MPPRQGAQSPRPEPARKDSRRIEHGPTAGGLQGLRAGSELGGAHLVVAPDPAVARLAMNLRHR